MHRRPIVSAEVTLRARTSIPVKRAKRFRRYEHHAQRDGSRYRSSEMKSCTIWPMEPDDDFSVGPHRIQVSWDKTPDLELFGTSRSVRRRGRFSILLDRLPALNDRLRQLAESDLPGADQLGRLLEQG